MNLQIAVLATAMGVALDLYKTEPPDLPPPVVICASERHYCGPIMYYTAPGAFIAEFNIDGRVYLGFKPSCGEAEQYCPDVWTNAVDQLMNFLWVDYPDAFYATDDEWRAYGFEK
mgnify:CR=1 FL=1